MGWWVVGGGPEDVLYIFMFLELVYQCDALPDVFRWLQFFLVSAKLLNTAALLVSTYFPFCPCSFLPFLWSSSVSKMGHDVNGRLL